MHVHSGRRTSTNPSGVLKISSMVTLAYIGLPLVSLLARAEMAHFKRQVCCEPVLSALHLSAVTSCASALIIVLIGTPLAYALTFGNFRGKRLMDSRM